jgi:hypothetical protein
LVYSDAILEVVAREPIIHWHRIALDSNVVTRLQRSLAEVDKLGGVERHGNFVPSGGHCQGKLLGDREWHVNFENLED